MTGQKAGAINGVLFFLFWLLVLLAVSDKPPPAGFVRVVVAVALSGLAVVWRTPTYISWSQVGGMAR